MYIGRLQLKGFKSFGGSHDLILSPGFTAIVGPNGSGKSNLLDALRWALGDSNAGRLRIARQSDLLFQGSVSLQAAKEAEVSMQLREDMRTCLVKRRVSSPDGATSLFIDNERKTLAELDDIKRDWNLEGDRFAFIGQGEVAEAIQERPGERRKRLESLFGTEVYRKRRMNAADRLVTVKEEYEQLRNFMAELNTRREEIAPEVAKASKLKEIMDSIEDDRRLLYWMRRSRSEAELAKMQEEIALAESVRAGLERWSGIWKHGVGNYEAELQKAAEERKEQTWELEQCRSRFESLTKSGVASSSSLRSSKARLAQANEEREKIKTHLTALNEEQKKNEKENKRAKDGLAKSQKALDATEKKWQEFNSRLEDQKQERESLSNEKGELEAELQKVKAKLSFLGKDVLDTRTKKEEQADPRKDIDKEIKDNETSRDKLLAEQDKLAKHQSELYAKVQNLAAEVQRSRREASQARSKLNEVTDAMQGDLYPRPVQYLLSAAKLNRLDAMPRAVIDVFTCDVSLSTALEAYLGGRQFQLLVEDLEEAGRCIDKLKTNAAGRATFLPLERCHPRSPDMSHKLPVQGIVGWAIDLVKVEEHWLPAIQQIMGDLLIVKDYAIGQQIVRSGFRGPVVTMEGDVFQPGGTVSGGRSQRSGKTIEMKSQVAKLEKIAEEAAKEAEKLSAEFKEAEAKEIKASEQTENYTRQIRELDGRIALLLDQKESFVKEQKRMENERDRLLESIKAEGQRWQEILASLTELDKKWDEQAEVEDDHQLIEERERLRSEVAVAAERASSKFALMERISNEIRSEEQKTWTLDEEIGELDQKCVQERAALAQIGKECLNIHNRRAELVAEIDKHVKGYSGLESKRDRAKNKLASAEVRVRTGMEKFSAVETKKGETERELDEMINNWEEKYPYPGKDGLPDDVNLEELRRKIRDGDRRIKTYGDVNMGVLSEDKNLGERLSFLGEQLDDVKHSAAELEKLIADADAQAQKVFTDALQEVDTKFCSLFQRLFGGGEAHLEMTDGETIWETGVDVIARPPGKHPQNINQLSGGEQSLAAISLLFASMEVANCPLAVLDEVDAALDEVNLKRFSELAKEYAQNRQILAMTHRRVTMERADVLYGVTLSEPGLSQVIGVRMEDWA